MQLGSQQASLSKDDRMRSHTMTSVVLDFLHIVTFNVTSILPRLSVYLPVQV